MWKNFLLAAGQGAAQGFLVSTQQPGVSIKNAGIAAGLNAATAALQFAVSHPAAQHPDVTASVAANQKFYISTDGGQTYQPVSQPAPPPA